MMVMIKRGKFEALCTWGVPSFEKGCECVRIEGGSRSYCPLRSASLFGLLRELRWTDVAILVLILVAKEAGLRWAFLSF